MKRLSILVLLAATVIVSSCTHDQVATGWMIPKDASLVVHVNGASLSSKLTWQEISQSAWFKMMHEHSKGDSLSEQIMADPSSSGVDTKSDVMLFVRKHGQGNYMITEGTIKDATAFENFMKKMHPKAEVKPAGDYSYLNVDNKSAVIWNKSRFAFASSAPNTPADRFMKKGGRTMDDENENGFPADSLKQFAIEAFDTKASDNLTDDRFVSLIKDNSDIHIWMNSGQQIVDLLYARLPLAHTEIFKNNVTAMSVNFDNGRITARTKHYFNDDMAKIIANNRPQNITADMLKQIPSSNIAAVAMFNYSPEALRQILKATGLDVFADMYLADQGIKVDDLIRANKGQIVFAVAAPTPSGMDSLQAGKPIITPPVKRTPPTFLFAMAVNDTTAFRKLLNMGAGLLKQRMGNAATEMNKGAWFTNYSVQKGWFAVSNSTEFRDKFFAGGNGDVPFADKITGHPIGIYVDLQKFGDRPHRGFDNGAVHSVFQDIVGKGGDYKDKMTEFDFEINFVDKNTNSLKQLNQLGDSIAINMKRNINNWHMDSTPIKMDSIVQMPKDKKKVK